MTTEGVVHGLSGQQHAPDLWYDESPESVFSELRGRPKPALLGLPCASCNAYYDADLDACPLCGCKWRVSPTAGSPAVRPKLQTA
jgi:hypothetical protein